MFNYNYIISISFFIGSDIMFEDMKKYQRDKKFLDIDYRIFLLKKLEKVLKDKKEDIYEALYADLGKNENEAFLTEYLIVRKELNYIIKNTRKFARLRKVKTSIINFLSTSYIENEPYGLVLVIAPWNYPINLSLIPLIGAVAAGNSVVLKPSSQSKATSKILKEIIEETFPREVVFCLDGPDANEIAMREKFDYIFFTGSQETGQKLYEKAARDLCPISLELGGKSPCLVMEDADLDLSVKRIFFGKFLNAGQTCVSVDYVLCHESLIDKFIEKMYNTVDEYYKDPLKTDKFGKIINYKEFDRLKAILDQGNIDYEFDYENRKISPVILKTDTTSLLMKDEIFGPVLPVIPYKDLEKSLDYINSAKTPLAFYVFTRDIKKAKAIIKKVSFGGGAINDTIEHISGNIPFGGFKESGFGSYHGKETYFTFVHKKSILNKSLLLDLAIRYPGSNINFLKRLFK